MLFHPSIVTPYRRLSTESEDDHNYTSVCSNHDGSSSSVLLEMSPSASSPESRNFATNPKQTSSVRTSTLWSSTPTDDAAHFHPSTFYANLLFFLGATCQTIISIWDYRITTKGAFVYVYGDDVTGLEYIWDNANDDPNNGTEYHFNSFTNKLYYILFTLGPVLYVCNALLDIRGSLAWRGNPIYQATSTNSGWFLIAATLFGMGAVCQIYSTVLDDVYEQEDAWCDDTYLLETAAGRQWFTSNYKMKTISMHLYLLSGLLHLQALRCVYCCCCYHPSPPGRVDMRPSSTLVMVSRLVMCGKLLFVVGALMDCLISWIYDPQTLRGIYSIFPALDAVMLGKLDVTSSFLWNAGAVLYLMAQMMTYHRYGCSCKVTTGWHSTVTPTRTETMEVGTTSSLTLHIEESVPVVDESGTTW
jgi:hypothetical protein